MDSVIVNNGNFIEEKILCKVSSKDFRINSFELLLLFFTSDIDEFLFPVFWLLLYNN